MRTSTVALLSFLAPVVLAGPINRDPALRDAFLVRRAPDSIDVLFNSTVVDAVKPVIGNPKKGRPNPSIDTVTPTKVPRPGSSTDSPTSSSDATTSSSTPTSSAAQSSSVPSSSSVALTSTTDTPTSTSTSTTAPTPTASIVVPLFDLAWQAKGWSFFDSFDFFTWDDPTHGQVNFNGLGASWDKGLISTTANTASFRVDNWTKLAKGAKRDSVRITSKQQVSVGSLIVFDVNKAPYGPSVWPAMWTVGPNWPNGGEIDIFEGVNDGRQNQMTLHTSTGCTLSTPMAASGLIRDLNCDAFATNSNLGCGVQDPSVRSFGEGLNSAGGGVWVTHISATDGIRVWFFLRDNIPDDIASGDPRFQNWGTPRASFAADTCDIEKFFPPQTIVLNTTICGDWAGDAGVWATAGYSGTCFDAVADPSNYDNAVFEFNSVAVYNPKF